MEEGDGPMPRGVDEFTTSHNATNEHQALDHTRAQSSSQHRHVQASWFVIQNHNTLIASRLDRIEQVQGDLRELIG